MITITLQPSAELLNVLQRIADCAEDLARIYADQVHASRVTETPSSTVVQAPVQAAPPGIVGAFLDVSSQPAQPARVLKEPTAPAAASSATRTRTPERKSLMGRMWPAGEPADKILLAVNALPGKKISDIARLGILAAEWGFRRPEGFRAAINASRRPPPVVAKPPAAASDAILRPVDADAEQVRSWAAQRGLRYGGPSDLDMVNIKRTELGLPCFNLIRRRAVAA